VVLVIECEPTSCQSFLSELGQLYEHVGAPDGVGSAAAMTDDAAARIRAIVAKNCMAIFVGT
jgi:hypothetical protein